MLASPTCCRVQDKRRRAVESAHFVASPTLQPSDVYDQPSSHGSATDAAALASGPSELKSVSSIVSVRFLALGARCAQKGREVRVGHRVLNSFENAVAALLGRLLQALALRRSVVHSPPRNPSSRSLSQTSNLSAESSSGNVLELHRWKPE